MKEQARRWIIAGACLDLAGAGLIAWSVLDGRGPDARMFLGIAVMLAGSYLVTRGALRAANIGLEEAAEAAEPDLTDWQPEWELRRPPPREARLTRPGRWMVLLWALAIVAAGAFFWKGESSPNGDLLRDHGVRTLGTIHDKVVRQTTGGVGRYIYYNFTDQQGNGFRSSLRVSESVYESLEKDDSVEILYLPEDPFIHALPGIEQSEASPPLWSFLLLGSLGVLALIAESVRRRHKRLVSHGLTVPGVVESVGMRGFGQTFTVSYSTGSGRHELHGSGLRPPLKKGDVVTVLCNRDKPARALLYRSSLYRAVRGAE